MESYKNPSSIGSSPGPGPGPDPSPGPGQDSSPSPGSDPSPGPKLLSPTISTRQNLMAHHVRTKEKFLQTGHSRMGTVKKGHIWTGEREVKKSDF